MDNTKKRLHMGRIKAAAQVRRKFYVDLPAGTKPEDVMGPDFFVHYTRDMQPLDLLEMMTEDGAWEGLFRVMFVSKVDVKLSKIYLVKHDDAKPEEVETDVYAVRWRGPAAKHGVIRKDTGEVVKDRFGTKEEAMSFLSEHLKKVG